MKPVLFSPNSTDFSTNGIGTLDPISCDVVEERNGSFELTMVYASTARHFEDIKPSSIICAIPNRTAGRQAFRVYKVTRPISGRVTVYAQHLSYQLSHIPVMPFDGSSLTDTLSKMISNSAEANPFTIDSDYQSLVGYSNLVPTSFRAMLGGQQNSLLDVYGAYEYEFDNYAVHMRRHRGAEKPITVEYGKNITDITQEENIANTVTGICPFWKASDSNICIYLPERVVESDKADNFPYKRTVPVDFSDEFEDQPTSEQLREVAYEYVETHSIGNPSVSIKVSFVNLADTEEYKSIAPLEDVSLCDVITVRFDKLGIDEKAKVIKTDFNVLTEKYNSVEIGDSRSDLASTVVDMGYALEEEINDAREYSKNATKWLTNGQGYVVAVKNDDGSWKELLFLDKPTTQAATKALRINENGIGFASGTAGTFETWEYAQAWTLDGHMTLGGVNNSRGKLEILSAAGDVLFSADNNSVSYLSKFTSDGVTHSAIARIGLNTDGFSVVGLDAATQNLWSYFDPKGYASEDLTSKDKAIMTPSGFFAQTSSGQHFQAFGNGNVIGKIFQASPDSNGNFIQISPTAAQVSCTKDSQYAQVQKTGLYTNGNVVCGLLQVGPNASGDYVSITQTQLEVGRTGGDYCIIAGDSMQFGSRVGYTGNIPILYYWEDTDTYSVVTLRFLHGLLVGVG